MAPTKNHKGCRVRIAYLFGDCTTRNALRMVRDAYPTLLVVWRGDPKMYGKQQALSKPVDFGKQKGIYILYDHHTVVYVGRSIDRPLGKRLYEQHHRSFR